MKRLNKENVLPFLKEMDKKIAALQEENRKLARKIQYMEAVGR